MILGRSLWQHGTTVKKATAIINISIFIKNVIDGLSAQAPPAQLLKNYLIGISPIINNDQTSHLQLTVPFC